MVEDGVAEMDDSLKERITALQADRDTTRAVVVRATGANRSPVTLHAAQVAVFGTLMREHLTIGVIPFRTSYLRAIIDRAEVDDHQIRICGSKDFLEQPVAAAGGRARGAHFCRWWRAGQNETANTYVVEMAF